MRIQLSQASRIDPHRLASAARVVIIIIASTQIDKPAVLDPVAVVTLDPALGQAEKVGPGHASPRPVSGSRFEPEPSGEFAGGGLSAGSNLPRHVARTRRHLAGIGPSQSRLSCIVLRPMGLDLNQ